MVKVCFYFQVHQPHRMKHYSLFDIGKNHNYFDDEKNEQIARKVADKCYLPGNKLMLELLEKHPEFRISYSISGTALEQFEKYTPEVIESFKKLVDTGRVEILSETYYHSLTFLFSKEEFVEQVRMHKRKVKELFGVTPLVFRNTELIYNNELASFIEGLGYKGIIAEGFERILGWRNANFVYEPIGTNHIKLLLKNYKLSDDIAFRFSDRNWPEWPLTSEKFTKWVSEVNGSGECVNLFMDYETIGEHQWEDTGIFEFLRALPSQVLQHPDNSFATPSELIDAHEPNDKIDCHHFMSWADMERDLTAWVGNSMQDSALADLYKIEQEIKQSGDEQLIEDWRGLTTSDHFYYMCTKWFADGDVHKYFNPYDTPYESYINFMNILKDLRLRLKNLAVNEVKTETIQVN